MNESAYKHYQTKGYNRIPVVTEVLADLDTPLSTYLKLARGDSDAPYSYLLESSQGGEKWGRYSIIGLPARTILTVTGENIEIRTDGKLVESIQQSDPLAFIEQYQQRFNVAPVEGLPRFYGGLVGYFSYDTVRYTEKKLAHTSPPDSIGTPDILLMVSNEIIVFDNLKGRMQIICISDPAEDNAFSKAQSRLSVLTKKLAGKVPKVAASTSNQKIEESDFTSEFGQEDFMSAVEKIRDYISAGDAMQVVLAQRMSIPFNSDPINLYRALRSLNPSPYMYFMDLGDFHIVSSSPEILARVEDGTIVNRPLAGTRRRGHTPEEDQALEKELLADPKELAEHLMLIDLGRNDVGRVAITGSVKVTEQFTIERYSHVMHISSNINGKLKENLSSIDVLRASLPVGTLSGAPKIRAMEIIDELEPVRRGIYGGAVGYIAWDGNMDMAIAIRTAVVKDGKLFIQAGGGVVADSIARLEWKESMNKGRAIFRAAALAENNFQSSTPSDFDSNT
ncbi:MAG: anthranilate synthase component I [Pseudomonadales bacterium]|nr:anthranilate synthase component I [Pseudomonadales bacterium]